MSEAAAPPPFKLTRESKIRIDRDGNFWHEGEPVKHEGLARGLASWIALDPATDRYILRNAMDWCFITVDDTPLVVRSVSVSDDGAWLTLSDGTRERLVPETLRIDADDVPYCEVKGGSLPARFTRTAAFALLQHAHETPNGSALEVGGQSFAIRRVGRGLGAPHRAPTKPDG